MTDGRVASGVPLWWSELACHDGTPYPERWKTDPTRFPRLLVAFLAVREECSRELGRDCPVLVLSGYRTPAYQASLLDKPWMKAALSSQHPEGRAIDGTCALPFARFKKAVWRASQRPDSPIRYLEWRPTFGYIHWDVRPTATLLAESIR